MLSREPVRLYLGGLVVALVAVLLTYGLVDSEQAAVWIAAGSALVGFPAVEAARAKVTPALPVVSISPDIAVEDEGAGELRLILCIVAAVLLAWLLLGLIVG